MKDKGMRRSLLAMCICSALIANFAGYVTGRPLCNRASGCPTQILVAIPIHNRAPSRYTTGQILLSGYATVLSRYTAGRTVLLLKWTVEIASRRKKGMSYCVKDTLHVPVSSDHGDRL